MDSVNFTCVINSRDFDIPLGLEIWVDEIKFFDQDHIDQIHHVEYEIAHAGDHDLRFVLKNKLLAHTQVDADGNIVSDATVTVSDIRFDGIDCNYLTTTVAQYQHDFNGTSEPTTERFHGEMGCNGTVSLKFSTPIHIWLLENM